MFRKTRKLLKLLPFPTFRKGLWHGVAASIEHAHLLAGLKLNTIVDVGANKGQYSLLIRHMFPEAKIYAFEPIESQAQRFTTIFRDDSHVTLNCFAIGDIDNEIEINLHQASDGASLLPLGSLKIGTKKVKIRKLDTVLTPDMVKQNALLKIDVQGYESRVIRGASSILNKFNYICCEVAFSRFLEGQDLAHEIITLLNASGFRLIGANHVTIVNGRPGQSDFLFERIPNFRNQ